MTSSKMLALLAKAKARQEERERLEDAIPKPAPSTVPAPPTSPPKLGEKATGGIDFKARLTALRKRGTATGRILTDKSNIIEVERTTLHNGLPIANITIESDFTELEKRLDSTPAVSEHIGIDGSVITYNKEQEEFVTLLSSGESCVLIGSAGTGKTTCTQGAIQALIQTGVVPPMKADGHKHLRDGAPGVITISYTRRAVNNIKKVLPEDLKPNCITAHKLLEFAPEYFEVIDPETGEEKKTMQFIPTRNELNPLPATIHTIIVEESSMVDLDLFSKIIKALQHPVQWVFIGDIQQLPPVFGSAILGYKMLELPMVQLTEVYRQALESPIIRLAQRILSGKPISTEEYPSWKVEDKLTLHPWKKKLHPDMALHTLAAFFTAAYDSGDYNIAEDMILIPYNKACGTLELNKHIANHIARTTGEATWEVMAGFNKHYFSVGDKVLYDKEDAEIVDIAHYAAYTGARVQPESTTLDYWGYNPNLANESFSSSSDMDIDELLAQVANSEDRVTQASHKITVKLLDTESIVEITKASEVNNLLHAYALTVHKAQGSEWRKVFLCLHQSHATMLQRELLYTAVTRAREELYVICEPESFTKGIKSQKIKGNTLEEKAEFFKGKQDKRSEAVLTANSYAPK